MACWRLDARLRDVFTTDAGWMMIIVGLGAASVRSGDKRRSISTGA
jgi:hypothetical protein